MMAGWIERRQPAQALLVGQTYWQSHPEDEDIVRPLLKLLADQGAYAEAERVYECLREALDEQGLVPDERTVQLRDYARTLPLLSAGLLVNQPAVLTIRESRSIVPAAAPFDEHQPSSRAMMLPPTVLDTLLQPSSLLPEGLRSLLVGVLSPLQRSVEERASSAGENPIQEVLPFGTDRVLSGILRLVYTWQRRGLTGVAIQAALEKELDMFEELRDRYTPHALHLTRREVLLALAILPVTLLGELPAVGEQPTPSEEWLSLCAAAVTSCWYLMQGHDFAEVKQTLERYLPLLASWANQSPSAASLAAQSSLLLGLVSLHTVRTPLNFQQRLFYCQQAVKYASLSSDPLLQAETTIQLAGSYRDLGNMPLMLQTRQHTIALCDTVPTYLQSKIYNTCALSYAIYGQQKVSLTFLGDARERFSEEEGDMPVFLSSDCGPFFALLKEGETYLKLSALLSQIEYARQAKKSLLDIQELGKKVVIPERYRIEIVNQQALAAVRTGELEEFRTYLTRGVQGAEQLQSEKRLHEAKDIYREARQVWPHEVQIKGLAELFVN
jgi:tetratricopeptide (TPR) repeat protein